MRARRALLYVPGDDLRKIKKAVTLDVDCICLDLEDGVAINRKVAARSTICQALESLDFGRSERLARINPVGSGLESLDLEAILPAHPDGIVVPKVEHGDQLRWVSRHIGEVEQARGWTPGSIALIAIVETAKGIVNLPEIIQADARLQALIFGAEDFASDIGATRTPQGWEVFYARSAVVTHAAAADLQAIDQVYVNFQDFEGLMQDTQLGMQMGFSGKQIIHPNQVQPVQEIFTPSQEAIQSALDLMEAFDHHQREGRGAFAIDGKMIDAPIIKAAARVLEKARAAGKL